MAKYGSATNFIQGSTDIKDLYEYTLNANGHNGATSGFSLNATDLDTLFVKNNL